MSHTSAWNNATEMPAVTGGLEPVPFSCVTAQAVQGAIAYLDTYFVRADHASGPRHVLR